MAQDLITLDDARNGFATLNARKSFEKSMFGRIKRHDDDKATLLWNAALGYHAAVVVGVNDEKQSQGDYAIALYGGNGKANGTMLKRLSYAALSLDVAKGSPMWKMLVQAATSGKVGDALKSKDAAGNTVSVEEHAANLDALLDEWTEGGGKFPTTRAAQPDNTDAQDENAQEEVPQTPAQAVRALSKAFKDYSETVTADEFDALVKSIDNIVKRERTLAEKRVADAAA